MTVVYLLCTIESYTPVVAVVALIEKNYWGTVAYYYVAFADGSRIARYHDVPHGALNAVVGALHLIDILVVVIDLDISVDSEVVVEAAEVVEEVVVVVHGIADCVDFVEPYPLDTDFAMPDVRDSSRQFVHQCVGYS